MKKVVSLLLVLAMAFVLCGCEISQKTSTKGQNGFAETSDIEDFFSEETSKTINEQQNTVDITADTSSIIVYRTKTGAKYHLDRCLHLKSKIETTVEDAKARGLKPCLICNPPK